ncbi:MAG: TlpA family protein disulfide reductase [Flavobacteriia bacterium]|nr:TlpA family protein disulfide reductase [Flavobacteriia bacterium]
MPERLLLPMNDLIPFRLYPALWLAGLSLIMGCKFDPSTEASTVELGLSEGVHRGRLLANDSTDIAFNFDWQLSGQDTQMVIFNADERIVLQEIERKGDSLTLQMPVFNPDKSPTYKVDAVFERGETERFPHKELASIQLPKKWRVLLYTGTEDETEAAGEFFQEGQLIKGSFLTETGDYRFLEGVLNGTELRMSTFDGAHAYAFTARLTDGGELDGHFYSGKHFHTRWTAEPSDSVRLGDPLELTQLTSEDGRFDFQFRDQEGELFDSQRDQWMQDKVTIVQIMGSWCPNCMDEIRYMTGLRDELAHEDLRLVGITFERRGEWKKDRPAVERMIQDLAIDYPLLYGGGSRHIRDSLPQIAPFRSFPTSIFIDREGRVRRIHAGFSGPGTSAYAAYAEETRSFVSDLLNE